MQATKLALTPRFAVEAHLANVFAEKVAAQTEQYMTQEEEVSSEPGEQVEVEVPMQLLALTNQIRSLFLRLQLLHKSWTLATLFAPPLENGMIWSYSR